ncbi:putative alginate O-acetylase AlgJ [Fundidesulfovibrio magnetotacticus]|uniref:Putative alginate O-acetylase AlgJ n=1 Tax=Fundidesulfovibrio magnetotacticus TaxID=2730080 RepID=A0A6V8LW44_9BACT|nr:hypothetical protein [Fundidesulfovibrio magnetotacticus]GFK94279.1 putative alginate O-acetylase AlgJ [Fundidesulfovibrio magnetotacticus]
MNHSPPGRRLIALCSSALFCLAIALPLSAQLLHFAPREKLGEATSTPFPEAALNPAGIQAVCRALTGGWLDKNFPFRGMLIRWHNFTSTSLFGSLSGNAPVVVGKEGWLYLAKDRGIDLEADHRSVAPLTAEDLDRLHAVYAERRAWLAERGIAYLVVIAPNKSSVYPEHLPASWDQAGRTSHLEQAVERFRRDGSVDLLDLREPLMQAKVGREVFYRTDSHWNAYGAFPSYQAIIERLAPRFPVLKPMREEDFIVQEYAHLGGDLSFMVGLEDLVLDNKVLFFARKPLKARGITPGAVRPGYVQPAQGSVREDASLPRAIFFHDSYFWELVPFLGEHFSRAVYVWVRPGLRGAKSLFDKELIEKERPDVVVEEIAERFFLQGTMPPREIKEGAE